MTDGSTLTCSSCGVRLATDQRYCLDCGTSVGSPLNRIRASLGALGAAGPAGRSARPELGPAGSPPAPAAGSQPWWPRLGRGGALLSACLGLGILFGALVSPNLQTLAAPLIALGAPAPAATARPSGTSATSLGAPAAASTAASTAASANTSSSRNGGSGGTPATGNTANTGSTGNTGNAGNSGNSGNTGTTTTTSTTSTTSTTTTEPVKLPPIKHVWLVVLSDQSETGLFGKTSTAHYLNSTLVPQGTLLTNYYATSHGALADGIALLSGQGPTPEQQQNCPVFTNLTPGTVDTGGTGQVHGHGCVLPTTVYTLPDQMSGNGLSWKAYIAGQHNAVPPTSGVTPTTAAAPSTDAATCRHPVVGAADPTAAASDGYLSRRNPFVYFHSIIDTPSACAKTDVGLDQLATDLQSGNVPALSWIVPDPCAAGAAGGCAPNNPVTITSTGTTAVGPITLTTTSTATTTTATTSDTTRTSSSNSSTDSSSGSDPSTGSASTDTSSATESGPSTTIGVPKARDAADTNPVDAFLQEWIPKIEATAAYKRDGMIVILSDQAPASGPSADSSACCGKLSYVNTTNPGGTAKPGPGGGRIGALVLSTYAGRGVTDTTRVDHFTLLRTLDDIFNVPYLGYALQREDFDSVVFPSESGGSGAVSTRVQTAITVITRALTTAAPTRTGAGRSTTSTRSAGYTSLSSRPSFAPAPPPGRRRSSPAPSFASG